MEGQIKWHYWPLSDAGYPTGPGRYHVRRTITTTLAELADRDERIMLLTGDLGYLSLDRYRKASPAFLTSAWPSRTWWASPRDLPRRIPAFGLFYCDFCHVPPLEFIRKGPVLHHLPVRILGVGGGVEYGTMARRTSGWKTSA